jgi:PPOX class probable F420-dependent enzyme
MSDSGTSTAGRSSNSIMAIPNAIRGRSYISLTTFRKNGVGVPTPVWFGEKDGKMYVMSRPDAGKVKRIRNNPQVQIAPSTIRGKVTGPEFSATATILPQTAWADARKLINQKYWMARIPFLWSKDNVYLELEAS